jgi:acyl-CoA thioester hydrolase
MEEVLIRTRLIDFSQTTLVVEGLMLDRNASTLKSLAWFEFVHISPTSGKPIDHPEELMRLCDQVAMPEGYDPNGFNRRVEALRRQMRSDRSRSGGAREQLFVNG